MLEEACVGKGAINGMLVQKDLMCYAKILAQDSHNLLRPETMESLFVLWRVTGKVHFQEWAWAIFRAFQRHTRVPTGGYANLDSCLKV